MSTTMTRRTIFSLAGMTIGAVAADKIGPVYAAGESDKSTNTIPTRNITLTENVFPYVRVTGSSYDMGYQHGAQVPHLIERYLILIERITGKSRDVLAANARKFVPVYEAFNPAYVEEVRGLAKGAGISFEEAMICQLRGAAGGCTTFAVTRSATRDGHVLAGQNQDMNTEMPDVGIVLHVIPSDGRPRAITFTFAGQLGFMGMNSNGVGEFANALSGGKPQKPIPGQNRFINHYPLKRTMLEQKTVEECIDLYQRNRVSSAANVMLCDGQNNIADIEVTPGSVAVYKGDNPDFLAHANHYVTPEFGDPSSIPPLADSPNRHARMTALIKEHWGNITAETMKTILADHDGDPNGICRHSPSSHSISGYIAEPAANVIHIRRGHGCIGSWTAYVV